MTEKSKVFCALPWKHLDIQQSGEVFPCCRADLSLPLGHLKDDSLEAIWNSSEIKQLRLNMLRGIESPHCRECYQKEKDGGVSFRQLHNKQYESELQIVNTTEIDGSLQGILPQFLGVRYSNLCNLKCRYCDPIYSTRWFEDAKKLDYPEKNLVLVNQWKEKINDYLLANLSSIKSLYFAGGEALLEQEHFDLINGLIEKGRTDVQLIYNTNFTTLDFKGQSLIELWNQFDSVRIDASLDSYGAFHNYIRHGVSWNKILENRKKLKVEGPKIDFWLFPTMSILNIGNFPQFAENWIDESFVHPSKIHLNILESPALYSIKILPKKLKAQIKKQYLEFLNSKTLRKFNAEESLFLIKQIKELLIHLDSEDKSSLLPSFLEQTKKLDFIRGESFFDIFNELKELEN